MTTQSWFVRLVLAALATIVIVSLIFMLAQA